MKLAAGSLTLAGLLVLLLCPPSLAGDFAVLNSTSVRDQAGRRIRANQPYSRIISLYGAHTENLYALGAGSRVVGVSDGSTYPPRAREKESFSYQQGVERFLAADPDLVLIRPMIDRGHGRLVTRLEEAGVTVVSLQPRQPEEIKTYWRILGALTGRQKRAGQMIAKFRESMRELRTLGRGVSDKKTVYFEAIHDQMKTFAPESIAMHVLESAGGINAAADARSVRGTNIAAYGKERILARGEEIDVYLAQKGPMNQPTLKMIRREPGFSVIRAIRRGRIHIVEEEIVSRPTPRLLLGAYRIGRILYPDTYTPKVGEKVSRIIRTLYSTQEAGYEPE